MGCNLNDIKPSNYSIFIMSGRKHLITMEIKSLETKRFLCSRLWDVFLCCALVNPSTVASECFAFPLRTQFPFSWGEKALKEISCCALSVSFQFGQMLTAEQLYKNAFEYLVRFELGQTVNIPGRLNNTKEVPKKGFKKYYPPKTQDHSQRQAKDRKTQTIPWKLAAVTRTLLPWSTTHISVQPCFWSAWPGRWPSQVLRTFRLLPDFPGWHLQALDEGAPKQVSS